MGEKEVGSRGEEHVGVGGGRSIQGKARKDEEKAKARKEEEEEEEEEERDNIIETRFETSIDYGSLQPLPPYPVAASLDAEWILESEKEGEVKEEKNRKARGKASRGGKKGVRGRRGFPSSRLCTPN